MKHFLYLLFFISTPLLAQPPQVLNISSSVDQALQTVTIGFTLADCNAQPVEVYFSVSDDNGATYFMHPSSVTGDVGPGIGCGTGKQIVWDYSGLGTGGAYMIKVTAVGSETVPIQDMADAVDSLRLIADMGFVEGTRHYVQGAAHLQEVKDSIQSRFAQYGLNPYTQNFQYGSYTAGNIIGRREGLVSEDTVYIVDGHFESVANGPGADDNGSAVIGVLEAARILSQYQFRKSIRFIGFDLEEQGLFGSQQYVSNGILPGEHVEGVINFEMIGYYSEQDNSQVFPAGFNILFPAAYTAVSSDNFRGNFITNVANTNSSPLKQVFDQCAALYVPGLKVISIEAPGNSQIAPDLRRSDHAPFWDANYKALMLTDGAEYRNQNYHTPNDVSDSLDFKFIMQVVQATVTTLATLAEPISSGFAVTAVMLPGTSSIANATPFTLEFFPNPGDAKVNVKWNAPGVFDAIALLDLEGKTVYSAPLQEAASQHVLITETFADGVYIVKLSGASKETASRLVIKH